MYELSLVIVRARHGNTSMQWLDTEGETHITAAIDECGGVSWRRRIITGWGGVMTQPEYRILLLS